MNRRIAYKDEAKCNFCFNWFQVYSEIKFGLNICEGCIYKALNTSCFKLPTPHGHLYQVYLARRNISLESANHSGLLQKIDQFMHTQIRNLLDKWQQISRTIITCLQVKSQSEILRKVQGILSNDAKRFQLLKTQTISQINQDILEKERKMPTTPLKQKNLNSSLRFTNKSLSKSVNRAHSRKQLNQFTLREEKTQERTNDPENDKEEQRKRAGLSPTSHSMKRIKTLNYWENKETKDFLTKMQVIKSNIISALEGRGQQVTKAEPLKILREKIYDAIQNTNCMNKCIELVSYNGLLNIDMKCYLGNLEWEGVQVVKFVKVGLTDDQLATILQFLKGKSIESLVLTGNNLTQESCRNLLKAEVKDLKNIYMGKNQIFSLKAKKQIKQLKQKYNFYL